MQTGFMWLNIGSCECHLGAILNQGKTVPLHSMKSYKGEKKCTSIYSYNCYKMERACCVYCI